MLKNDHDGGAEPPRPQRPPIEAALRYLGARQRGELAEVLVLAIELPDRSGGRVLAPLVEPTSKLDDWTPAQRADAILQLIAEGVVHSSVGPTSRSRRRHALQAAFRLRDASIDDAVPEEWGTSLAERFKQLRGLRPVFGDIDSTQPVEVAWTKGVAALTAYLQQRFRELDKTGGWEEYRRDSTGDGDAAAWLVRLDEHLKAEVKNERESLRDASAGAQPVFVNLLITDAYMKGRAVHRRVTERLVTARGDAPVPYHTARGFTVRKSADPEDVPVRALWGCRAEVVPPEGPRRRGSITRLVFPKPLLPGQQAYFASEAVFDTDHDDHDREWIDVNVDHHGIARGRLLYGGRVPISGLTIRVRFDEACVPAAAWWYAEANEDERYHEPPPDDPRLLPIINASVAHTFEQICQPREHYGVAFSWPAER